MLRSVLDFPENEGDSRKLKKVQELIQHFREQCRMYRNYVKLLQLCKIMYRNKISVIGIDESLRPTINYEAKKRKGKKENCSLYKSETNLYKIWYDLI